MKTQYLSFVSIGGGSSWGYGDTPCEAVEQMLMALTDWTTYYDLSEVNIYSAIYDVTEYDGAWIADHRGLYGKVDDDSYTDDPLKPVQFSRTRTPKHAAKKRRWSEAKASQAAVRTVFADTYEGVEVDAA
tara:strand:+ start:3958 stop:4347 length:390 start_codon:yes stop_codon:yes gene_type:complete